MKFTVKCGSRNGVESDEVCYRQSHGGVNKNELYQQADLQHTVTSSPKSTPRGPAHVNKTTRYDHPALPSSLHLFFFCFFFAKTPHLLLKSLGIRECQ